MKIALAFVALFPVSALAANNLVCQIRLQEAPTSQEGSNVAQVVSPLNGVIDLTLPSTTYIMKVNGQGNAAVGMAGITGLVVAATNPSVPLGAFGGITNVDVPAGLVLPISPVTVDGKTYSFLRAGCAVVAQ